jgi:hypothetical protein
METPDSPGRKWRDLSTTEQDVLRQNPDVVAAEKDWEYYRQRRASPKEQQIEAAFKIADEQVTLVRNGELRFRDGNTLSMAKAYDLLLAGEIDGDKYREYLAESNTRIDQIMADMDLSLKEKGLDLDVKHEERVTRLKELFGDADSKLLVTQLAVWESELVTPEQFTEEVTVQTPSGAVTYEKTDWDAFDTAKDNVLNKYGEDIQLNVASVKDKWKDEGVSAYREASEQRSIIEELPRYRGLNIEQSDKIDVISRSFRDLNKIIRAKIGLPSFAAPLPQGMGQAIRIAVVKQMVAEGYITTQDDVKLATLAIMMEEDSRVKEVMRGPEQLAALIENPETIRFYPYLLTRIPQYLLGQLPESIWNEWGRWNDVEAA